MDSIMLTAITFFVLGFVIAGLLLLKTSKPEDKHQPADMNAVLQEQLRMQMTQNMMRQAQLEQARQEQEIAQITRDRAQAVRWNYADVNKRAAEMLEDSRM